MARSEIIFCSGCQDHPFQDPKYGFHMRVMNPTGKGEKSEQYRCTVCGKIHSLKSQFKVTVKKEK